MNYLLSLRKIFEKAQNSKWNTGQRHCFCFAYTVQLWTTKAHMFSSAWGNLFCTKLTSDLDSGPSKHQKMASTEISHSFLGTAKFWAQKIHFIASVHPPLCWFLPCYARTITMTTYKTRCGGLAWGWHWRRAKSARLFFIGPQIYLKWKFLYAHLCQNLQYLCNSDTKIKLRHQKGVDCTFFGIFSKLLRGTAKFWGSKNENIAFLSDWLVPIFLSFYIKKVHFCSFRPFWAFFRCQNQITKTGGLWSS